MKWLKIVLVSVLAFILASCYDINENIVINTNGSGTYVTKMDMGQFIDMMQTFAGDDELSKEGLDRPIDTTIQMKDIMDSAKDITPEQKELMKDGVMKIKMNMREKVFNIDMSYPYKNFNGLQMLMAGQSGGGLTDAFKKIFGSKLGDDKADDKSEGITDQAKDPGGMDQMANIFDVTVKDGLISKKVNADKYKALMSRPEMDQVKQMGSTGMEITYTTTMQLPRPAKKTDNPVVKLSDDKRTVTIKYNLVDLLDSPDKFSYTIEY